MKYNPYVFVKGFEERLSDLKKILTNNLKTWEIHKGWENHLEILLEPAGWQAIWKVPRNSCSELKIIFPCTVIVYVEQVNFKDLSCQVSVIEVEDDNNCLPGKITDVPLVNLYPTQEQDSSIVLFPCETAELIDCLRFFYNHLWMPWDLELDEDTSWMDTHLEGRLQLYFMILAGKLPLVLVHDIDQLVTTARHTQQEIAQLEEFLPMESEVVPTIMLQLTDLHNKLMNLGNQYAVFEKPPILKAVIERHQKQLKLEEDGLGKNTLFAVISVTTSDQLMNLAKMTNTFKKPIRCFQSLQETLIKAQPGSVVWVFQGEHPVWDLGHIKYGGSITGIEPGAVITDQADGCSALNAVSSRLCLTGLTIRMSTSWTILKVRPDVECVLNDINVEGSTMTDGVDVFPGAKLIANRCNFTNCSIALIGYVNSTVVLSNCTFTINKIAIQIKEGCNFSMENCSISGSTFCGVQALTSKSVSLIESSIYYINSLPLMKISGVDCKNNTTDLRIYSDC